MEANPTIAGCGVGSVRPVLGGVDLTFARACIGAAARAYQEATYESELAQVLVIPCSASMPTILAFRGSADVRAWLTDFRIELTSSCYGRLHSGFWNSACSVWPEVRDNTCGPVIVTGHSKGAAEALICARLLADAGRPVQRVVTFGGPRVGDCLWRANYDSADFTARNAGRNSQSPIANSKGKGLTLGDITERWVHEEDIVPRVPPWFPAYRHVGHEYFMSSFFGLVELDPPLLRLAASDIWGTFWGYRGGRIEQIVDHPVTQYQKHIASL